MSAEPTGELREEIGQQVLNTVLRSECQPNSGHLALEIADALLSGPLAPLLAKVQAVEALAATIGTVYGPAILEKDLRRALDGSV